MVFVPGVEFARPFEHQPGVVEHLIGTVVLPQIACAFVGRPTLKEVGQALVGTRRSVLRIGLWIAYFVAVGKLDQRISELQIVVVLARRGRHGVEDATVPEELLVEVARLECSRLVVPHIGIINFEVPEPRAEQCRHCNEAIGPAE